jgi:hypothetical protein
MCRIDNTKRFLFEKEQFSDHNDNLQNTNFFNFTDRDVYCIDGDIQGGKTKTMLSYMLLSVASKLKTIAIVRNLNEDAAQMKNATKSMYQRHSDFFHDDLNISYKEDCVDIKGVQSWANHITLSNTIIVMANISQLKILFETIKEFNIAFSLFIDEADLLMNSKNVKEKESACKYIRKIVEQSKFTYLVSATNFANYFQPGIYAKHIICVERHKLYKGIDDLEFETLEMDKTVKGTGSNTDIFKKSPRLKDVIDKLTTRKLYDNHPTILLAKCSNLVTHHEEIVRSFYNSEYGKDVWSAISFNGDGCLIYTHSFIGESEVEINGIRGLPSDKHVQLGVFHFKGLGIMKALSYLKTLGSERIIIASGMLAGRCINFMDDEYDWHVTDEYIDPAESGQTDAIIQSLRICGIHKNPTPLVVWCSENVEKDIMCAYKNLVGYIRGIKDKDMEVFEVLKQTVMAKTKTTNRKMCSTRNPIKITADESKDNTDEFSDMTKTTSDSSGSDSSNSSGTGPTTRRKADIQKIVDAYYIVGSRVRRLVDKYREIKYAPLTRDDVIGCVGDKDAIGKYIVGDSQCEFKLLDKDKDSGKYSIAQNIMDELDELDKNKKNKS